MNPGDAQLRAQSELQSGESLNWTGIADPGRAAITALPATIAGVPFTGFSLYWINGAYHASSHISNRPDAFAKGFSVFPLFGLPFLLLGLSMVLAPLWVYLKGRTTVYAITNQRVLVISGGGNRSVKSYTPADMVAVEHRERPDGSGDVIILTNAVMKTRNSSSPVKVQLCGIPNVRQVAEQVLALHAQRPAA